MPTIQGPITFGKKMSNADKMKLKSVLPIKEAPKKQEVVEKVKKSVKKIVTKKSKR